MIFVLFEVVMKENSMDHYLEIASVLKKELSQSEGFIQSERFSSLVDSRKLLSLSKWETEEAVTKWRNQIEHRIAQQKGRDEIFESYTITITTTIRCYTDTDRTEAPADSNAYFHHSS